MVLGPNAELSMSCGYVRMLVAVQKVAGTAEGTCVEVFNWRGPPPPVFLRKVFIRLCLGLDFMCKGLIL